MAIDPQVIRSEQFDEIGQLIQRDASILIERWSQRAVAEQPNGQRVHHEALLDRLPVFLAALGRSLAESDDHSTSRHREVAVEHGEQRWEVGWSLPEVVRDYQILRLIILEYVEESLDRPPTCREVMAIGLALDEAIAASVGTYVRNREDYVHQVEQQHAEREQRARQSLQEQTEALQVADQRKNEFLAMLAHEMRNPLAPILNAVEMLQLSGSGDPTVVQVKGVIERQVRQMVRLVDDLLDLTRIAQGKIELRRQPVELAMVVAQVIQASDALIKGQQHQLSVSLPTEPLWLEADQARLVQVLSNLVNNAVKFTEPGGQIWMTGEREGEQAVIRVRDNGVGIPAEMLSRVFDLFTQVAPSADRSQGGLGIGLALVRKLVETHGGTVTAHSAGLGQGSEFVVRLPAGVDEDPAPPQPAGQPETAMASRRILIVEDNVDGRETLGTLLRLAGHEVELAADGPQGVALALAFHPQAALIDLQLPGLDGFQVAHQIRAALGSSVFLIALTGFGQAEDRRRTLEAGFAAHLIKPVDLEELTRLLVNAPAGSEQAG